MSLIVSLVYNVTIRDQLILLNKLGFVLIQLYKHVYISDQREWKLLFFFKLYNYSFQFFCCEKYS
jgi:hypothetical protein